MPGFISLLNEFSERAGGARVEKNISLAPFTTFKIGGPADLYVGVSNAEQLIFAIKAARRNHVPFFLLGMGANILVGDKGFRGIVIHNRSTEFQIDPENGRLECESGVTVWPDLIEKLIESELSGLEHFAGIPSSVGGAVWQNLHFLSPAPKRERTVFLDEVFHSATILTPDNQVLTVDREYFQFGYDTSILHFSGDIVTSVIFQLEYKPREIMKEIVRSNLEWRKERHPPLSTEPSVGSIFKKIEGIGAGRLIDGCGMKGTREGGIEISHRHANIMINVGEGTARDVRTLIERAVKTVKAETGYELEPEIAFVGDFS